ncbi:hypothetical protein Tco_0833584 [Tanacetum coccineum]
MFSSISSQAYEPHAKKDFKKQEQSYQVIVRSTGHIPPEDALMDTMTQIAILNSEEGSGNNGNTVLEARRWKLIAFLDDVECTAHYDQPTGTDYNKYVSCNHEDAYESEVDEAQCCSSLSFMANFVITMQSTNPVNEVHLLMTIKSLIMWISVESGDAPGNTHNGHKVKLDLENKVRQEQALVIQRNKRNAELVQENDLLKSTLSGKEKSIAFLQSEKEKILSEKKELADSYLDEIVCLKTANKVARDMLQRFNMPTQTIPMLSKKPKKATDDLHKDILGTRNPGLGYMAKRAQPVLYDADTLLHPNHHPVSIWDSEDVLVHQVVSMKKMNEKPGHVRPANGFYDKLNALMFVPQQELSREQALSLHATKLALSPSCHFIVLETLIHPSTIQSYSSSSQYLSL